MTLIYNVIVQAVWWQGWRRLVRRDLKRLQPGQTDMLGLGETRLLLVGWDGVVLRRVVAAMRKCYTRFGVCSFFWFGGTVLEV